MFVQPKGVISSPNYKGQYPSNIDCSWLVHLSNKRIGIKFSDFHTQRAYDRLAIYNSPYSNMKRVFDWSGTIVPYGHILTRDYMYLRFTSSKSNDRSYNGFKGQYEQYLFVNKKWSVLTIHNTKSTCFFSSDHVIKSNEYWYVLALLSVWLNL